MASTSPKQLLALGTLGFCLLWGVSFLNGTLDNMDAVIKQGFFPGGRSLRSVYTGNSLLDARLTYLTAFYEPLSNALSAGPRLLFFDLNFMLSCTNAWVFIESRRRGVRNIALRHPVPFMVLWNAMGAAFVQPFYFYFITQSKAASRDPTIPLNEAIALFITTLPTVLFPLFLFAPAWLKFSTWDHQGYIAIFQGTPFLIVAICLISIALMLPRHGLVSKKDAKNPNADRPWIVASFIMAGTIAAAVHIFTILHSLNSREPDMTLTRLFIPSMGKVNCFSASAHNSTLASTGLSRKGCVLLEGFHLFTQFDLIVVALSCIVFTHCLLSNYPKIGSKTSSGEPRPAGTRELAYIALGTVVFGPGAAGSWALALRESRLREQTAPRKAQWIDRGSAPNQAFKNMRGEWKGLENPRIFFGQAMFYLSGRTPLSMILV